MSTLDPRMQALLDKAERLLDGRKVTEAMLTKRAIVPPERLPDCEGQAQTALEKLRHPDLGTPTPEEIAALAVVLRIIRPVLLINGDAVPELPRDPQHNLHSPQQHGAWNAFREKVREFVGAVGRIELADATHIGTGFLVAPGLVATNRHVLAHLTLGGGELFPTNLPRICFGRELDGKDQPQDLVELVKLEKVHPTLDVALLRVAPQDRKIPPRSPAPVAEDTPIAVLGYPARDDQNPLFLGPVFNNIYGFKRIAMGEVIDGGSDVALYHDCSTSQGNSGSPVFSLETGQVVGIHRSGQFMYRNEAVPCGAWEDFLPTGEA